MSEHVDSESDHEEEGRKEEQGVKEQHQPEDKGGVGDEEEDMKEEKKDMMDAKKENVEEDREAVKKEGGGVDDDGDADEKDGGDDDDKDNDDEHEEGGGDDDEEEPEEEEDMEEDDDEEFIPLGEAKAKGGGSGGGGVETSTSGARPPWYRKDSVDQAFPLRTLHNEILDLCDLLMPTPTEKAQTDTAVAYVRKVVAATLGIRAKVDVFGSQLTGLVLPGSDIDTVVTGGPHNSITLLGQAMFRRKNLEEVRDVTVIGKARVPLVKFVHVLTGKQVDVCFNQASGLQSGAAARELMRHMQPVRPLVMVLKAYMGQRKLNETYHGGIGSFLLQLMVVALVQKCAREARDMGHEPPTNLGFLLDEFFDFYGNKLNYASTGITLLGEGGGGFYNKAQVDWFLEAKPFALSMQNPHEQHIDVGSNSYKADVCKKSFKATSLRLKCAIQRAIASSKVGGDEETAGFLKYVVHPGGDLADRVLPPPLFCTGSFDQDPDDVGKKDDVTQDPEEDERLKMRLVEKARLMMEMHGASGKPPPTGKHGKPGQAGKGKRKAAGKEQVQRGAKRQKAGKKDKKNKTKT